MRIDHEEKKIWVRQSWLNDVMICPERSRLAITLPEWRQGSDATHIGTAVHKGIEHMLTGESFVEGLGAAKSELERLISDEPFKINSTNGVEHMREYVESLLVAFDNDIRSHVEIGGRIEANFGVPLFEHDDYTVMLGGTMDYVEPNGTIWDWKTAGRKYSQGEKQRQSIQGSAYAIASVKLGWNADFPVTFKYGVVTRTSKPVGQIVPIIRTQSHVDWFNHQVQSIVKPFIKIGLETPWPANDQHGLCSEKWCPYWSICKGATLTDFENNNTQESING